MKEGNGVEAINLVSSKLGYILGLMIIVIVIAVLIYWLIKKYDWF